MRIKKLPMTLVIHRRTDRADTRLAMLCSLFSTSPLKKAIKAMTPGRYRQMQDARWAFNKIADLWQEEVESDSSNKEDNQMQEERGVALAAGRETGSNGVAPEVREGNTATRAQERAPAARATEAAATPPHEETPATAPVARRGKQCRNDGDREERRGTAEQGETPEGVNSAKASHGRRGRRRRGRTPVVGGGVNPYERHYPPPPHLAGGAPRGGWPPNLVIGEAARSQA